MKVYGVFGNGSKINQVIIAILINVPVFVYGASVGWLSPMSLLLQSDQSPTGAPLSDSVISLIAAIPYLVCVVFDFVMAFISDRLGRKFALIFISVANAISWILLLVSTETWALILARALIGIPMAGAMVTCPMYTKEISDDSIRGSLGCLVIMFQTTGNLFLYIIGDLLSYRTILWICLSVPIVHVIAFVPMPESPSYLVKKGKTKAAVAALAWLKCKSETDNEILEELDLIIKEQKNDAMSKSKFALKTLVTDKFLSKAFTIAMMVTLAREVCGAIPVLNFAGEIFASASEGSKVIFSPNQQAMVLGAVQVIGAVLASTIVEKAGRKTLLFVTSLMSGLSMCGLASWFLLRNYDMYAPTWIPLMTLCLCIFCDSSGLQPVSLILAGEIVSYKYRSTVMAATMSVASVADFFQMLAFKPLANMIGIHVAFYFFGAICILMAVYVLIEIPETKGRSLEEIQKDLSKGIVIVDKEAKKSVQTAL